jgi:hypothetical protein
MPAPASHDDEIPKRLDKETINELPLIRFHGAIQVAEDSKSLTGMCPSSKNSGF